LGINIDAFHGERTQQIRRLLTDPKNLPYRREIKLGDLILDLNVNAIYDDAGAYVGVVVNWEEISDRKRLEADMARVQSMMESTNINVMYADRDLVMRYMNPASKKKLTELQQYLPAR
jgi:methyl-accepting chemotaxis protein